MIVIVKIIIIGFFKYKTNYIFLNKFSARGFLKNKIYIEVNNPWEFQTNPTQLINILIYVSKQLCIYLCIKSHN